MAEIVNLSEIVAAKVGHRELAKNVVEDRRRLADRVIAGDFAGRLEPGEDEGVDEFLQRKQFDCEASPWASACNERAFPGGLSPQVSTFEFSNLDTTLLSGCLP